MRQHKDHTEIFFDYGVNVPTRTIYLGSAEYDEDGGETGVDFFMAEKFIKGLHILDKTADSPIQIIMNNPGGDVVHGMAIYDAIKGCRSHVTIFGTGCVMSMGSYIFQAADERILAPNAVFMFHEGYDGYGMNHPKIIDRWREFYAKKYGPMLNSILINAINAKRSKDGRPLMTPKQFEKHNDFDTILTAAEAVEWGLADAVKESP